MENRLPGVKKKGERSEAHEHRGNGSRFTAIAEDKPTAFLELVLGMGVCGELPGQDAGIFPKLPGYENKHSASSSHICTRLLCGRPKHASGKSGTGWRLSRGQHAGQA